MRFTPVASEMRAYLRRLGITAQSPRPGKGARAWWDYDVASQRLGYTASFRGVSEDVLLQALQSIEDSQTTIYANYIVFMTTNYVSWGGSEEKRECGLYFKGGSEIIFKSHLTDLPDSLFADNRGLVHRGYFHVLKPHEPFTIGVT